MEVMLDIEQFVIPGNEVLYIRNNAGGARSQLSDPIKWNRSNYGCEHEYPMLSFVVYNLRINL
jgi:hypothetical protein